MRPHCSSTQSIGYTRVSAAKQCFYSVKHPLPLPHRADPLISDSNTPGTTTISPQATPTMKSSRTSIDTPNGGISRTKAFPRSTTSSPLGWYCSRSGSGNRYFISTPRKEESHWRNATETLVGPKIDYCGMQRGDLGSMFGRNTRSSC